METERGEKEGEELSGGTMERALPIPMPMLRNQKTRKETYHICGLIGRLQRRN